MLNKELRTGRNEGWGAVACIDLNEWPLRARLRGVPIWQRSPQKAAVPFDGSNVKEGRRAVVCCGGNE